MPSQGPATASLVRQDAGASTGDAPRADCAPGGACAAPGWGLGDFGPLGWQYVGLDRTTIDYACTEQLMYTIVSALVDDGCRDTPTLSGEAVGEATDCVSWLADRGYYEAQQHALFYSRQYGGGGVVCIVDDGRPPELEVDITAVRDVDGFYALPKWYLVPADAGSDRVRAGWYGQRIGRPEHYWMTPLVPPNLAELRDPLDRDRAFVAAGGSRYHRSRVIPWPYRSDLDLRQARRFPNWAGWGPGVVEGCIAAYLNYRIGALRTDSIMASSHFNVLKTANIATALSTPDGGAGIRNIIAWVKSCLAETQDGTLPFTTIDNTSSLEPKSHTLTGVADIVGTQRQFLLDCLPEYPAVRIFGDGSTGGISGDSGQDGQWRVYYGNVGTWQRGTLWTAGRFGGGQQQAVRLAMLAHKGPTRGQLDLTVKPVWPGLWQEGGEATARTRKLNSESRAMDKATLGLTPAAMLRHDATLAGMPTSTYPSLDVDDGPLPELGTQGRRGVGPGQASPTATEETPPAGATTPASAVQALTATATTEPKPDAAPVAAATAATPAPRVVGGVEMGGDFEGDPNATAKPVAAPMAMPADMTTEVAAAKVMRMTPAAFRRWARENGVALIPMPKGSRGGSRLREADLLAAMDRSARATMDALRG